MAKLINEVGNTYTYLTVIERGPNTAAGRATWKCKCKCGNEVTVLGKHLRSGNTKSCGCYQRERAVQSNLERAGSLIGQRFGKLTVIEEIGFKEKNNGRKSRIYNCLCDCGNYCIAEHVYLNFGDVCSCGCLRSKGEFQIEQLLKEHNILFRREYMFEDLQDTYPLRFDFAFLDKEEKILCLLEFQGEQHTNENNGFWNPKTIEHDKMKVEYCKERKIPLKFLYYKRGKDITWEQILNEIGEYVNVN